MVAPPFDLSGGVVSVLARAVSVGGVFCGFGTLLALALAVRPSTPTGAAGAVVNRLGKLSLGAILVGILGTILWFLATTLTLAEPGSLREWLVAWPVVLWQTRYGHLAALRVLCLLAACVALFRYPRRMLPPLLLMAAATVMQAGHSHAASTAAWFAFPVIADALHVTAAAAWLGGLPALLIAVRGLPPGTAAAICRRFGRLALGCVVIIAVTAGLQAWWMIGDVPGLLGTAFGWVAACKGTLFVTLLALAWRHRSRLVPRLATSGADTRPARTLFASLALETATGLAVIVAAATLASLPPSVHLQPVWPLPWRLSLTSLREDPDFMREGVGAAIAAAAGLLLCCAALWLRRRRMVLAGAGVLLVLLAAPHLDLFVVEAAPTAYFRSPSGFSAHSIAAGAGLYAQRCAACHGGSGRGDGPLASRLPLPPADLTSPMLWMHEDGALFWIVSHGIDNPEGGGLVMPGFASTLSDDQRWALIDYIRANNVGQRRGESVRFDQPVRLPRMSVTCGDDARPVSTVGGGVLMLTFPSPAEVRIAALDGARGTSPPAPRCAAADPEAARALAITAGVPVSELTSLAMLVDAHGWLRSVIPAAHESECRSESTAIRADPLPIQAGAEHVHNH